MLSSPARRWVSNQLIRRKTASSFLFFFWDTVDFRRAWLLGKRTTARGLIRRMGLGRGIFCLYSLFLFLPWQTVSLYPLHRYTMLNYELSTFGLFLSQMRKFLVSSWAGAVSIYTKFLVRNSGNILRQVERFSRHRASFASDSHSFADSFFWGGGGRGGNFSFGWCAITKFWLLFLP